MKIFCKDCSKEVLPENINFKKSIAKCNHCNAIFFLNAQDENNPIQNFYKEDIPKPQSVNFIQKHDEIILQFKQVSLYRFFLLFFVLSNTAPGLFFAFFFLFSGQRSIFLTFGIPSILINLIVFYFAVIVFFSKINIQVNAQKIIISYGLDFWRRKKIFDTRDIKQIYCKSQKSSYRMGSIPLKRFFKLCIVTYSGTEEVIVKELNSPEIALFVEQEIEKFLRITDQRIEGDYKQ